MTFYNPVHNIRLSMSLKGIGFADRDAVPRDIRVLSRATNDLLGLRPSKF